MMPLLCADGYVRLTADMLYQTSFVHLFSAVDDECLAALSDDQPDPYNTILYGYTEWVSTTQPALSLGWDWQLEWQAQQPIIQLINTPRTNIMLTDSCGVDLEARFQEPLLRYCIGQMDWFDPIQDIALPYLPTASRYSS